MSSSKETQEEIAASINSLPKSQKTNTTPIYPSPPSSPPQTNSNSSKTRRKFKDKLRSSGAVSSAHFSNHWNRLRLSRYWKTATSNNEALHPQETETDRKGEFKYESLDPNKNEIRLLEVLPISGSSTTQDTIQCHLVKAPLDDDPKYEALSYTWGSQKNIGHIVLNGSNFKVSHNLKEFLAGFRSQVPKTLWVDAICINQASTEERNHQVSMMREIYGRATQVRVWLGPEYEDSGLAFALLYKLWDRDDNSVREILRHRRNRRKLEALSNLFGRDYWFRVWVVQEVVSAQEVTVHWGSDSMNWSDLVLIQEKLATQHERTLDDVLLQLPKSERGSELPHLFDVLHPHLSKNATDPRDHIYGIIGLTKARDDPKLQIDYRKPVRQLFTEVSEHIISASQKLDVICSRPNPLMPPTPHNEFPSWVADWRSKGKLAAALFPEGFRAAGKSVAIARCDTNRGTLFTRGFCIDRVQAHGLMPEMRDIDDHEGAMNAVCGWHELLRSVFANSRKQWGSFINTVSLEERQIDSTASRQVADAKTLIRLCKKLCPKALEHNMLYTIPWQESSSTPNTDTDEKLLMIRVSDSIYRRKFFISESKILGIGHAMLQRGDLICILLGCRYPVILRRAEQHFFLLGAAYVDGYMWGKAISEANDGNLTLEEFEIH